MRKIEKYTKYLKKFYKVLLCLIVVGIVFPALISLLLLLPPVQTYIANVVIKRLSYDLEAKVAIKRVLISPLSGITVTDFLICDQHEDTIFFAPELRTGIDKISFKRKSVSFGKFILQSPKVNLLQYDDEMNYNFIINALSKIDDAQKWNYSLEGILIRDGKLKFHNKSFEDNNFLSDTLFFNNLILDMDIFYDDDSNSVIVNSLSIDDNIGMKINNFNSKIYIHPDSVNIAQLYFQVNNSIFDINRFDIYKYRLDSLTQETDFNLDVKKISIDAADIRLLVDNFPELKLPISFAGQLNGSFDNIKGKINIEFGDISTLMANFDISNLSNIKEAFFYLDVKDMQTSIGDIEHLFSGIKDKKSKIPTALKNLGIIRYKGNYSGFFDDIVAYGLFQTNIGNINTDLGIKIQEDNNVIFSGLANAKDFRLGDLTENENSAFEKISFDIEVSGNYQSPDNYFAFVDGDFWSFDFNEYQYNNIELNGLLTNRKFDGFLKLDDPNGNLNFLGKVDMSEQIPRFNFLATVENAHLDKLNLFPFIEEGILSLTIDSNFEGINFDDLAGVINIRNGTLSTPKSEIDFDSLSIKSFKTKVGKKITLESDFAEGEIEGNFNFLYINQLIYQYLNNYLPSSILEKNAITDINLKPYNFEFDIKLKEIAPLTSLLLPDISISNFGHFKGTFDSQNNKVNIVAELEHFRYKNFNTLGIEVDMKSNNDRTFVLTARAATISAGNFLSIHNFSVNQMAYNDTLLTNIFWNNWEDINYSGALYSDISFSKDSENDRIVKVDIQPSAIIFADTLWNVKSAEIMFDSQGISVKELGIERINQYISLDGNQLRENEDNLTLKFNNFDLGKLMANNQMRNISFAGMINGEINIKDYFRNLLLTANITINDFIFNGEEFGTFWVNSTWNPEKEALSLTTAVTSQGNAQLIGAGYYHPKQKNIDITFDADSLSIAFLNPFLKKVLQNVTGTASGDLFLNGPINKPFLTGKVKLNDGQFNVDLLNTSYSLVDSVSFLPNEIRFNNLTIKDKRGYSGKFYGSISHNSFKNLDFNLRLDVDNMLLLNTTFKNNPLYYGTLYGTGSMQITGTTDNAHLVIAARTRQNSRFYIPITGSETAAESSFINFMSKTVEKKTENQNQQIAVEGANLKIDMDVEVTPDAEIQIIFDERLGDILKGTGAGNIQLRIDQYSNIRLYGDYLIESGEYFFSLQNLINRKFTINPGGTLRWQGDPQNAMINLTAVYRAKASLSDLFGDSQTLDYTRRRVPVNCNLILSENLRRPIIKFDIDAPDLDESTETLIRSFITTEEEMNRQVISLLLLNSFYTPEYMRSENSTTGNELSLIASTADILFSQISRWVSTISDLDIGVAYRQGDDLTSEEFELALSTQILNNRVTINGNVGYGKYLANNASKMIGDLDVDVKLNRSGTIRAKAFTHSNEYLMYETSPNKHGVGVSFREEYNKFGDLLRKYKNYFIRRKKTSETDTYSSQN